MIDNEFTESKFTKMRTEHCSACHRETDHATNGDCHQCKLKRSKPKRVPFIPNLNIFPNLWQVNRIDKIIVALLLIEITLHLGEVVIDMMQLLKLV